MQWIRPKQVLCQNCSYSLFSLFVHGFASYSKPPARLEYARWQGALQRRTRSQYRPFVNANPLRAPEPQKASEYLRDPAEIESIVRQARQTFGETLPKGFLSVDEYKVYERLYGAPLADTHLEDVQSLEDSAEEDVEGLSPNMLMQEDDEGNLNEVEYETNATHENIPRSARSLEEDDEGVSALPREDRFQSRMKVLKTKAIEDLERRNAEVEDLLAQERATEEVEEIEISEEETVHEREAEEEEPDDLPDAAEGMDPSEKVQRAHPLTKAGHYGTSPSTIYIPKATFVDPVTDLLRDASNKQLSEVAEKTFGGPGLPNSTATFRSPNLVQQTISLDAYQGKMGEMEANSFLAAIYPGAYASIINVLVEVRKRLGSDWLQGLMQKPDGPRILDAGGAGAGVLAWRDIIKAEHEAMHSGPLPNGTPLPYGKSTVVTGSSTLRHRASRLLDNTTFIPRLPDYDPSRDHPSLESSNPQPRKQYDVIIAPYTLWPLKEDHQRKSQIQNFWSLLDPRGGVLILIEKGLPIGFEIIAGARETILKHHISSPGSNDVAYAVEDGSSNRYGSTKETGMIIAPCTNHAKCPMYVVSGRSQRRKDFCHFTQRFIRPPYLQRILGAKERNHEDVQFSYVAFRRGKDARQDHDFAQGSAATETAFKGYDRSNAPWLDDRTGAFSTETPYPPSSALSASKPHPLKFPRILLPPLKRHGHVTIDVCTPAGTMERWTVPRSFSKRAYRDARKSQWGDLWALGAKTRVPRNLRLGLAGKHRNKVNDANARAVHRAKTRDDGDVLDEGMAADVDVNADADVAVNGLGQGNAMDALEEFTRGTKAWRKAKAYAKTQHRLENKRVRKDKRSKSKTKMQDGDFDSDSI